MENQEKARKQRNMAWQRRVQTRLRVFQRKSKLKETQIAQTAQKHKLLLRKSMTVKKIKNQLLIHKSPGRRQDKQKISQKLRIRKATPLKRKYPLENPLEMLNL